MKYNLNGKIRRTDKLQIDKEHIIATELYASNMWQNTIKHSNTSKAL